MALNIFPLAYSLNIKWESLLPALPPEFSQSLKLNCDEYEPMNLDLKNSLVLKERLP
jgi:hypothetical protein